MHHSELVTLKGGAVVSKLGLGTAQLGGLYSSIAEDEGQALVDTAISQNIHYFDTAPHYGKGVSERRLGGYLSKYPRESWVLSSKVGRLLVPSDKEDDSFFLDADNSVERLNDYTESGIRRSFEESLVRLQMEFIDIVYIHDPDDYAEDAINLAYPALEKMRSEGRKFSMIHVEVVSARKGKYVRAEPVAWDVKDGNLYFVGDFKELEEEWTTWLPDGRHASPNRIDAMAWAWIFDTLGKDDTGMLDYYKQMAAKLPKEAQERMQRAKDRIEAAMERGRKK